jgi:hypothetical protein
MACLGIPAPRLASPAQPFFVTMLARSGTKVSPTIVQLFPARGSGVIASSHPIQSGAFSKSSSERKQDMIELNIREWIRRERLERGSDKSAEKWITNGPR